MPDQFGAVGSDQHCQRVWRFLRSLSHDGGIDDAQAQFIGHSQGGRREPRHQVGYPVDVSTDLAAPARYE